MARRGRFGRRPRATGNLTALVAALYRQQQDAEDRVMFDAYKNGGLVDGKPVTDGRLRDYIAARRDGISKDDPLYDEWNNRLIQLDFRIGESKVTLAFQQGKVGAGAVASYYRGQLGKIPKDSEFYREVAGRAAQWAKAVGGAARGRARAGLSRGLASKADAAMRTKLNFDQLDSIVRAAAIRAGLIDGNEPVSAADASALQAFFAAGVPGPNGTTITFADWSQAARDAYKSFDQIIEIERQKGNQITDNIKAKDKFLNQVIMGTNAIEPRAQYEAARDVWLEAVENAQGDPASIMKANQAYAAALGKVAQNASLATGIDAVDNEFIGGLNNEIAAVTTGEYKGPGVADYYPRSDAGDFDGRIEQGDDTLATAESTKFLVEAAKALDEGRAYYGQAEFGGPLGVVPFQPGTNLLPNHGLGPATQDAMLNINGQIRPVKLQGLEVQSKGLARDDGAAVESVPASLFGGTGGDIDVENLSAGQIQFLLANGYQETKGGTVGYVFQQGDKQTFGVIDPATGGLKFMESNPFGSLVVAEGGYGVFAPSVVNPNTGTVVPTMPQLAFNVSAFDDLIVDSTVLPATLRTAAAAEADPEKQAALLSLADKRQKGISAESEFMQRQAQGGDRSQGPSALVQGAKDFIRNALGVAIDLGSELGVSAAVPTLGPSPSAAQLPGSIYGATPPSVTQPPPIAPTAPPALPPGTGGAPGAYRPPEPPPNTTGAKSQGGKDDIYKPPPLPPSTSPGAGGGGGQGNKVL